MTAVLRPLFIPLLISAPLLFGLHLALVLFFGLSANEGHVYLIHGLIFGLTAAVFLGIAAVFALDDTKVGFAFLASVILKMLVVVAFFFLYFKANADINKRAFILHFFMPYFVYLALEAIVVFKQLSKRF